MKVKVHKKNESLKRSTVYHLKPKNKWREPIVDILEDTITEVHFVRQLPENAKKAKMKWCPTIEEDDGVTAIVTVNDILYVVIGNNTLYANQNSRGMFQMLEYVTIIDGLELINTSKVENFEFAFGSVGEKAKTLSLCGLCDWDTSSATNMAEMFYNTGAYASQCYIGDLSNWNVSNVENMYGMFCYAAKSLKTSDGAIGGHLIIGNIGKWDVSKVKNMTEMFYDTSVNLCYGLDLSKWNIKSCMAHLGFQSNGHIIEPNWMTVQ